MEIFGKIQILEIDPSLGKLSKSEVAYLKPASQIQITALFYLTHMSFYIAENLILKICTSLSS